MEVREELARMLCERNGIDPDRRVTAIGDHNPVVEVGEPYDLWEYWAAAYVDPILRVLGSQDRV